MNKIKIIDLLYKIANGEKYPKIKFNNNVYKYHDKEHGYCRHYYDNTYICLNSEYHFFDILNDEVEIIEEEKKIPEKLEDISEIKCVGCKIEINIAGNKTLFDTDTPIVTEHCIYKINQLIKNQKKILDYLESKEKGE